MGIMSNKVTRRVALGSIAGGLAGTVAVLTALRSRYKVDMPSGTGTVKVTQKYRGRDITLEVPQKRPSTLQEQKELEEQIVAQIKKNPAYIEAETQACKERRDKQKEAAINRFAEVKKQQLANLAKKPYTKEQKQASARVIEESVQTNRAKVLANIDRLAEEDIARLSKP